MLKTKLWNNYVAGQLHRQIAQHPGKIQFGRPGLEAAVCCRRHPFLKLAGIYSFDKEINIKLNV
jgi:hypothetical protein